MNKPIQNWNSSLFQISKWENENNEEKYINYSIQKSFKVNDEWKKHLITSISISEMNRLKVLLDEVIKEHFIKKKGD